MLLLSDVTSTRSIQSNLSSVQSILVSEQKYQNNLKNLESEKNIFYNSHIYNVYVIFY